MSNNFMCVKTWVPIEHHMHKMQQLSKDQFLLSQLLPANKSVLILFHSVSSTASLSSCHSCDKMTCASLPVWKAYDLTLGMGSPKYLHYIYHLPEIHGEGNQWRKPIREELFIVKMLGCGNGLRSARCSFRMPQELQNRSWNLRCTGQVS